MPDGLTYQAALAAVIVALGLSFGAAVLVGGGTSSAKRTTIQGRALVQSTPASKQDLLTAARAVPALRALRTPREGGVQLRTPTYVARPSVTPAVTLVSAPIAPVESPRPTPTPVPREVTPPPSRATPAPKPTPVPTSEPTSAGDFDSTGDVDTAGGFDTTGQP